MFRRPPVFHCLRATVALALALPFAAPAATVACADSPPTAFALSIGSGVMRGGTESRIDVEAHADGCVAVHRPWWLRDAGDYERRLGAQEWAALQRAVAPDELGKVDAKALGAQTGVVWQEATADAVILADPDADTFTLQWRDGSEMRRLVARNPEQAAARQPKALDVNRVAAAVGALRALAVPSGRRVGAEGTP